MTSGKKTRFLDASEIERGIEEVAELAKTQRVRVALIGGAALQLHGSDRLTKDIDFAADAEVGGIEVIGSLDFGGVEGRTHSGVPVDLVVRDDDYRQLYEEALDHSVCVEDLPLPVVTPEYLIAMKMVAGRGKDEVDLEFLVAESGADLAKAREIIKRHLGPYAADEFDCLVDESEWRRSRRPRRR